MASMDQQSGTQPIGLKLLVVICGMTLIIGSATGNNIKKPITYYIEEELASGKLIGNLIQDAALSEVYSSDELASLTFKFISSQESYEELFSLSSDGTLLTRTVIDRDALCPTKVECILSLDVEVSPVDYFQIIKIKAIILDINDNRPTFKEAVVNLSLPESTPIGSVLQVPMAYDPDSPANGIDHYALSVQDNSSQDIFGLKINGDLHSSLTEIYLELVHSLDREERSSYVLELTAIERNVYDMKQSVLIIQVSVTDVNDNMPVFSQSKYAVTVPEDIRIGTALIRVTATDLDSEANGKIRYSLSERSVDSYGLMFRVDNATGEIYTRKSLDYEDQTEYTLVLIAVDKRVNGLTGESTVIINVKDVNDNAPKIRITSLGPEPPKIQIPEHSEALTPIAHVSVEDPDQEKGGLVSCIVNDTKFSLTQIYANDFMLRSAEILDREMTSKFDVTITCKDHGQPELVNWTTIRINVLDINDNKPVFEHDQYNVVISDNIQAGDVILQVTATDPDDGDNGNVTYTILDSDMRELFSIDKQSGIVRAGVDMSNVAVWDLKIRILAEDMGENPLSSTTILNLSSVVNRSTCKIRSPPVDNVSVFHVEENWPRNITISQLFVVDSVYLTCRITTVVYPDEINALFSVNENGQIIVKSSLDREKQETYCFGVIVKRVCKQFSGDHVTVTSYDVQVIVDDQNDNAPIVVFPSPDNNTITLRSGSVEDRLLVAKIKGTDADDGRNAELTFSLINPEEFQYLWLNAKTGELYVLDEVPNAISSEEVSIKVKDNGTPSLSTITTLRISLTSSPAISDPQVMVAADNLTRILSIALPCGVVVVLLIILIVRLTRNKYCCHDKKDRNHINPTTKLNLADGDIDAEKEKLSALYNALGLQTSGNIDYLYPEKDLSVRITDIGEQVTDNKGSDLGFSQNQTLHPQQNVIKATTSRMSPNLVSSQDSDSGCSADMSHSTTTTDSWMTNGAAVAWNRDCPEQIRCSNTAQGGDPSQRPDNDRCRHMPVSYGYSSSGSVNRTPADPEFGTNSDIRNYEHEAYIHANKVRKYGIMNKMAPRAAVPLHQHRISLDTAGRQPPAPEDKWRRLSDPPNVGASTCRGEMPLSSRWMLGKVSYQDVEQQQMPSVYRSLSYSAGISSIRDNSIRNEDKVQYPSNYHNDNRYRESQENGLDLGQDFDKKRKIIYEAQV